MNATTVKKIMMIGTGLLILALVSCNNPSGPRAAAYLEPSTGIDSEESIGLTAGISLEGDAILANEYVDLENGIGEVDWVEGLSGNAMRTDTDGGFVRITDDTLSDNIVSGSVEAWVYPEEAAVPPAHGKGSNYYTGIVHKGDQKDYSDEAWSLQFHADRKPLFYFVSESGTAIWMKANTAISLEEWHYLVGTWSYDAVSDETIVSLYVDGVLLEDSTITIKKGGSTVTSNVFTGIGAVTASEGDVLIGSQIPEQYNATYGHMTFMGIIDEVALYNLERSAEDILAEYQVYFPAS